VSNITALSTIWTGSTSDPCGGADEWTPVALSDPADIDLIVYRGDSGRFRVAISQPDGTPLNISTATWDCDIRASEDAPDPPMATLDVALVGGTTNTVEVTLTAVQSAALTGDGVWDLEMTLGPDVQTIVKGAVILRKDVSR
jgi:hypothetical protein